MSEINKTIISKENGNQKVSSFLLLKNLYKFVSKRRKIELFLSLILMGLSGCIEIFILGITYPFIELISNSEINQLNFLSFYFLLDKNQINLLILIFIATIFLSMWIRIFNIKYNYLIAAKLGTEISNKLFSTILNLDYNSIILINSNYILTTITTHVYQAYWAINFFMQGLSAFIVLAFVSLYLISLNYFVFIILILTFSFIYFFASKNNKNKIVRNSKIIGSAQKFEANFIKESISSIRSLILSNLQYEKTKELHEIDKEMRIKESENQVLATTPKLWVESIFLVVLIVIAFSLNISDKTRTSSIAILGTFALAIQRLLPNLQKIYEAFTSIRARSSALKSILEILNLNSNNEYIKNITKEKLSFKKDIQIKNVFFKYKNTNKYILKDVNLTLEKGITVGIIGETGSGKSSLINMIVGLIKPIKGEILVDGVNIFKDIKTIIKWRNNISEVPQEVFLNDDSIEGNILYFYKKNPGYKIKLKKACEISSILDFINELKNNFKTKVGENGVNLSGGQKQRIGIARAIFKEPELLILDEATSALDQLTEQKVIKNMQRFLPNTTKIMISHNYSSLKYCDKIIEIKNNKINELSKRQFSELLN